MGRIIPVAENPSIQPILSLYLLAASIAAVMALVSSLCISRKKSPSPESSQGKEEENLNAATPGSPSSQPINGGEGEGEAKNLDAEAADKKPLPLPPGMVQPGMPQLKGTTSHNFRRSTSSLSGLSGLSIQGKLKTSLSMRVQGGAGLGGIGLGVMKQMPRRENKKHLKHEDSIWKKTIILGERCRPVNEDDDTVVCDEKGRRVSAYHPKAPNSNPISRQSSFNDKDHFKAPSSSDPISHQSSFNGQDAIPSTAVREE